MFSHSIQEVIYIFSFKKGYSLWSSYNEIAIERKAHRRHSLEILLFSLLSSSKSWISYWQQAWRWHHTKKFLLMSLLIEHSVILYQFFVSLRVTCICSGLQYCLSRIASRIASHLKRASNCWKSDCTWKSNDFCWSVLNEVTLLYKVWSF